MSKEIEEHFFDDVLVSEKEYEHYQMEAKLEAKENDPDR